MTRARSVLPAYLAAEGSSLFGNSVVAIVVPWLVLARTADPSAAAMVAACAGLVQVGGTFTMGQLIDRFGARRLAALADLGSAVSVASLALADLAGVLDLPALIVLAAGGALFDIPGLTARQTMMSRVAERAVGPWMPSLRAGRPSSDCRS